MRLVHRDPAERQSRGLKQALVSMQLSGVRAMDPFYRLDVKPLEVRRSAQGPRVRKHKCRASRVRGWAAWRQSGPRVIPRFAFLLFRVDDHLFMFPFVPGGQAAASVLHTEFRS